MNSFENYKNVALFCKNNWKSVADKVVSIANDVLNNRFLFDMPWDMERTEEIIDFKDKIDWYFKLNKDNESLFQLNRHNFLLWLCQSYYLTGDKKYIDKVIDIFNDFIDNVVCKVSNSSPWRTLEVAMRAVNWLKVLPYLKAGNFLDEKLLNKINLSLNEHKNVLLDNHSAFHVGSNWGIIQDSALFLLSCYFDEEENQKIALKRLYEEVDFQIMNDGMHWEQSCGYHNAVLFCLLDVYSYAKLKNTQLSSDFENTIYKMAELNLKWVKPNSHQPLLGDSDNNDIRDILSRITYLFKNSKTKEVAFSVLDYDSAWLYGLDAINEYNDIEISKNETLNYFLEDSGSYVLRSGYGKNDNYMFYHNGYLGGGHAHADKLSFELCLNGRDVLVDAGRYTYKNNVSRRKIKDASFHNSPMLKKSYTKSIDSWQTSGDGVSINEKMIQNEDCVYISSSHTGYIKNSVFVKRDILWIKPNIYVILDSFLGNGIHKYNENFHFASGNNSIKEIKNGVVFEDSKGKVVLLNNNNLKRKVEKSFYSDHYNGVSDNKNVNFSKLSFGDFYSNFVICDNENVKVENKDVFYLENPQKKLSKKIAQGFVINVNDTEYTLCIANKEVRNVMLCNNKKATGRITVYCNDKIIFKKW